MEKIIISGGNPLRGTVQISGSKNAALPIIAATLLTSEPCIIRGVPNLSDIQFMCDILRWLSVKVTHDKTEGVVEVRAGHPLGVAPYELVRKMRASVCLLGPLLARLHNCKVSLPGGCVIGDRPIDQHIKGLKRLGADVVVENGYVHARCNELTGNDVFMGGRFGSTVLGTANVLMAATLATGTTWIEGAACEPEIEDLINFLTKMGAKIKGVGGHMLEVEGVTELHGAEHTVIPDRIEAGTFMAAAAITGGDIEIKGARAEHLSAVRDKLEECGVTVERNNGTIRVRSNGDLKAVDVITMPYPGFPTDMQAQMSAMMTVTPGISVITEKVFPNRFMHISEMARLGADVSLEGSSAIVKGVKKLSGAPVMASDLRASAGLVLAGLAADGETEVNRIYHVDRGYERIDQKLRLLGAKIERVAE
ncbi:MAG TPA: UDP-N-acetylglucosamine 1-carboxyvinyltransferase [Verrucomicrobiae bacterium]|nr:UDP-N-acetylglucosamine 1-carboxyvinyltransferase [Verrucomicrobiae bacterium]